LTRGHQRAGTSTGRRDAQSGTASDPFDSWVDRQLRSLYGPVVDEPLPPRLRALLDAAAHDDEGTDPGAAPPAGGDGDARADGGDRADGDEGEDGGGGDRS
jgi:hypothetical protein